MMHHTYFRFARRLCIIGETFKKVSCRGFRTWVSWPSTCTSYVRDMDNCL